MLYYRDESELRALIKGRLDQFKRLCRKSRDMSKVVDFIMKSHLAHPHNSLKQLGFFERIIPDFGVQVMKIKSCDAVRFKADPPLLKEIETNGIMVDAIREGNRVALYGRVRQGKLVEAVALNLNSLPEPSQL